MADWGQFLNFEPATAEECRAAQGNTTCNVPKPCSNKTCDTRTQTKKCEEPIFVGVPKEIGDLLGDTVLGKVGEKIVQVPVESFVKHKSVVGLFFSGHWCPPSRTFTPTLVAFYNHFQKTHTDKNFEIVFISSDRSESEFNDYFEEMPWLAFPFSNKEGRLLISKKFAIKGIPTLILLDGGTGEVITKDGRDIPQSDPGGLQYPWKPRPYNEIIREGKLVDNKGQQYDVDDVTGNKITGIFFSGHWCPPSQAFTPKLIATYDKIKKAGKNFEIIFCSWDRSKAEFDDYFSSMPWKAIPYGDKRGTELKKIFGVTGIPHLTILDEEGKLIHKGGRTCIDEDPEGKEFPWYRKPIQRLTSGTADVVNDNKTVLLLAEYESDIPAIENYLLDLATEHHEKGDKQEIFFMYMTKEKSDRVLAAILELCSLRLSGDGFFPKVLLLDISRRNFYQLEADSLSSDRVRQFVQDYSDGKLVAKTFSQ